MTGFNLKALNCFLNQLLTMKQRDPTSCFPTNVAGEPHRVLMHDFQSEYFMLQRNAAEVSGGFSRGYLSLLFNLGIEHEKVDGEWGSEAFL